MNIKQPNISLPLKLTFLVFSMVLNCMGIVILQLSEQKITYDKLGFLESFKDLPIAVFSLFAVNFISRFGTKKSLVFALLLVGICSLFLPFVEVFWFYKLWFAIIGTCFAIGKICVYGIIRNNMTEEKSLAKTMNSVEASFMIGIFTVNTGFGWLISSQFGEYWKFGFMVISLISFITVYLFTKIKIAEPQNKSTRIFPDLSGFGKTTFFLFFGVSFFIIFIEQSFNSWLPAFYKDHLKVNSFFALQASSFLALFSYTGRTITSNIIQRFPLSRYFMTCVMMIVFLLIIISGIQFYFSENAKILLFLFPIIGLFLAPLYPVINSKMIAKIDKDKINTFTSLIVMVSSISSSINSISISVLFKNQMLTYYSLYILGAVMMVSFLAYFYFKLSANKI
ncbi:MFS transporter [Chryseobacterium sp. Ch-15]|uniref:MFS transporter n=1 Tax=Chryseobacterium muglaense TaxID=2893752 RepID=A0A9Q3UU89_9FLAO|nr:MULTISPECIES: MFS transporter [Chryseobacterium]MBD3905080.1 MFS transporter [Chryseobacterium muglaense]MBO6186774.1 MFS transporter [Chryseobacterium sp.]MCC9033479.1 MFS transporter [Chryseobacterium muglaense]MCM2554998.1 MFS transporter [Chryseobacterium muglaense]